jgi:preprotein translocase subunit SecG
VDAARTRRRLCWSSRIYAEGGERTVVVAFQVLLVATSVLIILLVLLHKGKGGGLSDLFGGGVSSSLGGSSIAERNLDRVTYIVMIVWVAGCVSLALLLKQ